MKLFLETARTKVYPFMTSDFSLLMELDSDPEVMRYLTGGRPSTATECLEGMDRIQGLYAKHDGKYGLWKILEKTSGEFIGWFLFRPCKTDPENKKEIELGYRLKREAWGHGYATEIASDFIKMGFTDYNLDVIWAKTLLMNRGSQKVMKKIGMKLEREFREELFEGEDKRAVRFSISRLEWMNKIHSQHK